MIDAPIAERPGIAVEGLTIRFGGLVAVDDLSLEAELGRITSLIGPNGAGKTTTFNALTGLVRPTAGTVHLLGQDVTARSSQARAQRGLGRTFQRIELFDSLTVADNVDLGREAGLAASRPWRHLRSSRDERDAVREASVEAIDRCGIGDLAERRPGELSTGQRRLVELARVVAGGFTVLLLDEPSSGLDRSETERFGQILCELAGAGRGILLVEHDMALVLGISHRCYVLDFGKLVFTGSAAEVGSSEIVRAAYLGSEAVEAAVTSEGA